MNSEGSVNFLFQGTVTVHFGVSEEGHDTCWARRSSSVSHLLNQAFIEFCIQKTVYA